MARGKRHAEIKRTPVDPHVEHLSQEVAKAARWLSKVLVVEDDIEGIGDLAEHLRYELLRLEEAAASGTFRL